VPAPWPYHGRAIPLTLDAVAPVCVSALGRELRERSFIPAPHAVLLASNSTAVWVAAGMRTVPTPARVMFD